MFQVRFLMLERARSTENSVQGLPKFTFSCKSQPAFLVARFHISMKASRIALCKHMVWLVRSFK